MSNKIERLGRLANSWSAWLNWVAGAGLVVMLGLAVADIVGIKLFKSPIKGAIEIVAFLGIVVIAFAMAYTYFLKGHIHVDFLVMRLPKRAQAVINTLATLLGLALFVTLAWRSYDCARVLQATGEVSMTQRIPFYPFVYAIAFCCIPLVLLLLVEFLKSILKVVQK